MEIREKVSIWRLPIIDFCHMVEFIYNIFISFISHIPVWQECQANSLGERVVSSANDAGTNLDPCFTLYTKFNSKCIIDLNVRAKAIKLLEENIGINLCELRHWFLAVFLPFLGSDTKSTYDRKINWTLLELKKNIFLSKNTIKKVKKTTHGMEETIYKSRLTRNLYPEYIKDSYNSTMKGQPSHVGKGFE